MLSKAPHAFRRCFCLCVCFFSTKGRTSLLFLNNLKLERVVNFYMYSPMAFKFHEEQNKAPLCHLKWNHVLLCDTAEERQADTLGRIHLITAHLRLWRGALSRQPAEKKTNCTIMFGKLCFTTAAAAAAFSLLCHNGYGCFLMGHRQAPSRRC